MLFQLLKSTEGRQLTFESGIPAEHCFHLSEGQLTPPRVSSDWSADLPWLIDELHNQTGLAEVTLAGERLRPSSGHKVALMQPSILPWVGFFELIEKVDTFVLLDDFQFSRQSWGQRNTLFLDPKAPRLFTLPIKHPKSLAATFRDIQESEPEKWRKKFLTSIRHGYARSPYFEPINDILENWLALPHANLAVLQKDLLERLMAYLGLKTHLRMSSEFSTAHETRSQRVKSLLAKFQATAYFSAKGSFDYMREDGVFPLATCPSYFQNHRPRSYPQGARAPQFIPYLAALDALFNLSPSEFRQTMRGTERWLSWSDMLRATPPAAHSDVP